MTQKEDPRKKSPTLKDLPEKLKRNLKLSSKRYHENNFKKKKATTTKTPEYSSNQHQETLDNELEQFKEGVVSEVDAIIDNFAGRLEKIEELEERVYLLELGNNSNS